MTEIILEKIINKLILDDVIDFSELNDKTIVLSLNDINFDFCFFVSQNKVFIFDEVKPFDAKISINFSAFKDLLNKSDLQDMIREDKIDIQGEIKTAQLLLDLLKNNNIKTNILEFIPSDAILFAKKIKTKFQNGNLKGKIINILIQPKIHS